MTSGVIPTQIVAERAEASRQADLKSGHQATEEDHSNGERVKINEAELKEHAAVTSGDLEETCAPPEA